MERWQHGISRSPQCRYRDHPSFSSTLLDAIYRSIDEEHRSNAAPDSFPARKKPPLTPPQTTRPARTNPCPFTSSSSDASSYGGFSSSEAESVSTRLRPIRTIPTKQSPFPPPLPPRSDDKRPKKERQGSIRSRLLRELRKGRAPASPGARFANFLNSLFAAKSKVSREAVSVAGAEESASSCSRSCLSKTSSSKGQLPPEKRTVRFCPVSVIVDDRPEAAPPARRVAEILRRSEMEEEEEEDGESDSSSDLFELENLAVIGRFRDELPVYETTILASCSGISRRLVI